MRRFRNTIEDVLARFDSSGGPDACWPWTRGLDTHGYGQVTIGGRRRLAHRVVTEYRLGNIDGKVVRHSCDNPRCGNPAHLLVGTQAENVRDRGERGRSASKLNIEDVRAIRRALAAGELQRVIGARYGVGQTTISQIALGRKWAWLDEREAA